MVEWNDAIFSKVARPLAKMKTIKKENSFPPPPSQSLDWEGKKLVQII